MLDVIWRYKTMKHILTIPHAMSLILATGRNILSTYCDIVSCLCENCTLLIQNHPRLLEMIYETSTNTSITNSTISTKSSSLVEHDVWSRTNTNVCVTHTHILHFWVGLNLSDRHEKMHTKTQFLAHGVPCHSKVVSWIPFRWKSLMVYSSGINWIGKP